MTGVQTCALPILAGYRSASTGSLGNVGIGGYYWSSTVNGSNSRVLRFTTSSALMDDYRAYGQSVRCIKD